MISRLQKELEILLESQLPGIEAHGKLIPLKRDLPGSQLKNYPQKGAVLVLIYPKNGKVYIVLMLRPDYEGVHSGQVSFPGGKEERSDSSLQETALRETQEEVSM